MPRLREVQSSWTGNYTEPRNMHPEEHSLALINHHGRALGVPVGNEVRALNEDRGACSERRQRLFGVGDELS